MKTNPALTEAKSTCDGLHNLIRKISQAAVDIDKGGSNNYEILALIASANTCVINLSTQLNILDTDESNVLPLTRQDNNDLDQAEEKISATR